VSSKSPPPSRNDKEQIKDIKDIRDEIDKQLREAKNTLEKGQGEETAPFQEALVTLEDIQKKISGLKGELKDLTDQLASQQDLLEKTNEKLKGLEALYTQKEANLAEAEKRLEKFTQEREIFEELEGHLKSTIEDLRKSISQEEATLADLQQKKAEFSQEIRTLTESHEALFSELEHKKASLNTLNQDHLDLKEKVKALKNEELEREKDLGLIKESLELREKYLNELEQKIVTRQQTLTELTETHADLQHQIPIQKDTLEQLRHDIEDAEAKITQQTAYLEELSREHVEFQGKIKEIKAEHGSREEELLKIKDLLDVREKYLAQMAYIAVSNSSISSLSVDDLKSNLSAEQQNLLVALSSGDQQKIDEYAKKARLSIDQSKKVEVPFILKDVHKAGLALSIYTLTLKDKVILDPEDPLKSLVALSSVQAAAFEAIKVQEALLKILNDYEIEFVDLSK